jgi:hypothetical protein
MSAFNSIHFYIVYNTTTTTSTTTTRTTTTTTFSAASSKKQFHILFCRFQPYKLRNIIHLFFSSILLYVEELLTYK